MNEINFLPWRTEKRRQAQRYTLLICLFLFAVSISTVFAIASHLNQEIRFQDERNSFLEAERLQLSTQVERVKEVEQELDTLQDRMFVSESIISNLVWQIKILEAIVISMPHQVYLDSIESSGGAMKVLGKAQTTKEVETMMSSLKSSKWVEQVEINGIELVPVHSQLLSQFEIVIM